MNTETNYAEHFYADISNDMDALKKNVNENPFSSVAQFLLLYSYKKNNDPSFEEYARKAAIYFNNIPWIQYQLLGNNTDHSSQPLLFTETPEEIIPVKEPIVQNPNQEPETENEAIKKASNISDHIQTLGVDERHETTSIVDQQINQNHSQQPEIKNEDTKEASNISVETQTLGVDEMHETTSVVDQQITQNPNQQPEIKNEDTKGASNISVETQTLGVDEMHETTSIVDQQITQNPNQQTHEETKEASNISVKNQTLGEDEIKETTFTADEQINQNPNQQTHEETKEASNISVKTQTLGADEIKETTFTADEQINQNPNQQTHEETKEASNISVKTQTLGADEIKETTFTADDQINQNLNQESENEEEPVAFEPLHTVDYFASQGIKISEEALENDHLGQQVKSFTAWLKSMKKLHPGQLPQQNDVIEKIIQTSAEVSNQNANVLTEAMAEVLIKQRKKEKAVEMYQKLSLMNPSKSSYFAAKIESLKTI